MNASAKVSVILPVLVPPQNLNRAIASVLKQSVRDLELIVVGTTNSGYGVEAAVAEFSASDSRVQYVRSESTDPSQAFALGLSMASTPWMAFQRDGDEWLLDRLAKQLACAEQQGEHCYLVAGRLLQYMPVARTHMRYWHTAPDSGRLDHAAEISDFSTLLQAALIRRSALVATGATFDPQSSAPENFEWCRRLIAQGGAAAIPYCVAVTYVSSGITKPNAYIEWFRQALKR